MINIEKYKRVYEIEVENLNKFYTEKTSSDVVISIDRFKTKEVKMLQGSGESKSQFYDCDITYKYILLIGELNETKEPLDSWGSSDPKTDFFGKKETEKPPQILCEHKYTHMGFTAGNLYQVCSDCSERIL